MIVVLIAYLVLGAALFFIPKKYSKLSPLPIALLQLVAFAFFFMQLQKIKLGQNLSVFISWIPELGLNFSFTLDNLSMLFVLLITFIGVLVFLYSKSYMGSYQGTVKFHFYLTVFSGAMIGLVLSSNMVQMFIFWELTSILSFLLISFFNEKESARKAAFQSLFVTGFGGLVMLVGFVLLGSIVGSYEFADWLENAARIKSDPKYLPALICILLGAFTKSAQFPFHFWLPGAMQAPTPVSSYLHSATMVKAGVFLLMRLSPVLGGTTEWTYIVPLFGVLTMLVGSYFSITQTDIKAVLAYTTISALGVLVLLIGVDTKLSLKAALVFLFVHAFYKAALFMLAGVIDKKTGTRNIDSLGGLRKPMPLAFLVGGIALLSMAGLPPMLGFLGKELIYEAKVQSPGIASLILILGVFSNVFMVAISLFLLFKLFLGKVKGAIKDYGRKEVFFVIGPVLLALLSLGMGLFPNSLETIVEPALGLVYGEDVQIKLKLWHGFNQVFFLSLFTVALGLALFVLIYKSKRVLEVWRTLNAKIFKVEFSRLFSQIIEGFVGFANKNNKLIQHGYHRYYLLTIIVIATLFLWFQLYVTRGWELDSQFTLQPFYMTGLIVIIALAAIASAFSRSRIFTIIAMGVVGYGISLIYLYYSAVDLSITQTIVETLTVVMFALILQRLPRFTKLSKIKTRFRDAIIALSFGGVMTMLALKAIHVEFNRPISNYFIENSYLEAFGENVVNVILVDFRALDTMGEVAVLVVAALGVFAIINSKTKKA